MKDETLKEMLERMKKSDDPYDRGMAKGIEITMKAYGRDITEGEGNESK